MIRTLLFLYAESPVHAGADTSLGAVDLPIQREAGTGLPVVWGQSLKGALRSHARTAWGARRAVRLFGDPPPGSDDAAEAAAASEGNGNGAAAGTRSLRPGSLSVGDAQLVAFPVPTVRETFAWVTSPLTLGRLARKASLSGFSDARLIPRPGGAQILAASDGWCTRTLIGPYVGTPTRDAATAAWASWLGTVGLPGPAIPDFFARKLATDLLTIPDGALAPITTECAELSARVQLEADQKTVAHGPFYSEYLPCETLLAALLECSNPDDLAALRELLDHKVLRLGGNETIGKGLMWCRFASPDPVAPAPAGRAALAGAGRG
jgi:CRISPR-associated protein Cmr4